MKLLVNFLPRLASLALVAVIAVPALHANTIFSDIAGPGINCAPQSQSCGLPISGANTGNIAEAIAFTPNANFTITSASAVLDNALNNNTSVDFYIYSNAPNSTFGSLPNAPLGEIGSATLAADQEGIFTANATSAISLLAHTQYWLVLTAGDDFSEIFWEDQNIGTFPWAFNEDGNDPGGEAWTSTDSPSAGLKFAIDGTPTVPTPPPAVTPEPASGWLLLTAFALAAPLYFKRTAWSR